jgi:cell division protease FtsH
MGGQPIRGLLLEGPPGTGKSYLGQAIATEAQLPFGYMSAPSIQGMFWGMDTLRVLSLYNKARKLARKHGACILFIDEIDAIGKSRSGVGNAGGMMGGMMGGGGGALNELLNQMDPLPKDGWKEAVAYISASRAKQGSRRADDRRHEPRLGARSGAVVARSLRSPVARRFPSHDGRRETTLDH